MERFKEDPSSWLPQPNEWDRGHRWRTYLWSGRLGVLVQMTAAATYFERGALRRLLRFEPDRGSFVGRLAPALVGDLVLREEADELEVAVEGSYTVPFGPLGAALNWIVLHKLAEATIQRFLREVAERLSASLATGAETSESGPGA